MTVDHSDRVRNLTSAFLDAHREPALQGLADHLKGVGTGEQLLTHRVLFGLARDQVGRNAHRGSAAGVREALAGVPSDRILQMISGQIAMLGILHRRLRGTEGPHNRMDAIHRALALTGEAVDGGIGAMLDLAHTGNGPLPGWGILVEAGRTHRECRILCLLAGELLDAPDPATMFEVVERRILDTFHIRSLTIAAVNHRDQYVEILRGYPPHAHSPSLAGGRIPLSHSDILCEVARTGRTEVIDGWDPRYHRWVRGPDGAIASTSEPADFNDGQTAFFVPILSGGQAVGIVATASPRPDRQTCLEEIERMKPFLHQVGATLVTVREGDERRRAVHELRRTEADLRRQTSRQEALLRISRAVQEMVWPTDLGRVMRVCLAEVQGLGLEVQALAVHRIRDLSGCLVETSLIGPEGAVVMRDPLQDPTLIRRWEGGRPFYTEDWGNRGEGDRGGFDGRFFGIPVRSSLDIPFQRGIVSVHSLLPRAFSDPDLKVLEQVAEIFSVGFSRMEDLERAEASRRALQETEERNQALLAGVPDMLFRLNRQGIFLAFKEARDFEPARPSEEFLGKRVADVLPAELSARITAEIRLALESGAIRDIEYQLPGEGGASDYEARIVPTGGEEVLAIVRDVSTRKRTEEELRRSEARWRTIIEAEPECVKLLGPDGVVLEMNRAGLEMVEAHSPDQVIGKPFLPLVLPPFREAFRCLQDRVFVGEQGMLEFEIQGLRGCRRWMESHAVPFRGRDGKVAALLAITRDITDRKKLEEQLVQAHKMEAVGRLAGGIAHDFNNLLQVVTGQCELMLLQSNLLPPYRQGIEEIRKAGERAAALTRQLLVFSRQQNLSPDVLDLNEVVGSVTTMLRRLIGEDIELITRLEPGLWPVLADQTQVEQILLNLAVNSRDAMPSGGVLTIETRNTAVEASHAGGRSGLRPGPYVAFAVKDTGHGMSEETMSRVFDPFFTTKEVGKGTGMGLAMVYGAVQQSGGVVEVASKPGEGALFTILFPRTYRPAPLEPSHQPPSLPRGRETVLVVEDEAPVRDLICLILREKGYGVIEAVDGQEALRLEKAHAGTLHLLVTDVVMPKISGFDLADLVTSSRPETKVLFISGYPAIDHRLNRTPGASFLEKPFTPDGLCGKVQEALQATGSRG